ncbi:hypothetical protein EC973_004475 [Apophysomyces ossiformis]|uniref:Uncharacterized protein n=1 Tax=Apophysomyces ossiformis TaxID=679940 RepID=A0A8H7BK77_9FUNG|nr:hypothetical protein EC973_004475 [Apophysomyces ossiformis]
MDRPGYIKHQLHRSWDKTVMNQPSVIDELQERWQCKGIEGPVSCYPELMQTFGNTVYTWGIMLWILKFIQAVGLLACYSLIAGIGHAEDEVSELTCIEKTILLDENRPTAAQAG